MGASHIRLDIEMHAVFKQYSWRNHVYRDWHGVDDVVELSRRYAMPVEAILIGMPSFLSVCNGRDPELCAPDDFAAYGRYAGEIAEHTRGDDQPLRDPQRARLERLLPRHSRGLRAHARRRVRRDQGALPGQQGAPRGRFGPHREGLADPRVRHAGRGGRDQVRHSQRARPGRPRLAHEHDDLLARLLHFVRARKRPAVGDRARVPRGHGLSGRPPLPRWRGRAGCLPAGLPADAPAGRCRTGLREHARHVARGVRRQQPVQQRGRVQRLRRRPVLGAPATGLRGRSRTGEQVAEDSAHGRRAGAA